MSHFDFSAELGAVGQGHLHRQALGLAVGLEGQIAVAEGSGQLQLHVLDRLGLEIGQFDFLAKVFERRGAGFGFKFEFDGLVNLARQLGVVGGFGQNPLEQVQQLGFVRLF